MSLSITDHPFLRYPNFAPIPTSSKNLDGLKSSSMLNVTRRIKTCSADHFGSLGQLLLPLVPTRWCPPNYKLVYNPIN